MKEYNLESYLSRGVANIVKGILKASAGNPKESFFLMQYAKESLEAGRLRKEAEELGEHIPPFLIASITQQCNLHCKGCYARANHSCFDGAVRENMTAGQWGNIFEQAAELGIGFILLAGGEPFMRRDVLEAAAGQKKILFPVFTNGTMIDADFRKLLCENRNLIPILSLEGKKDTTDTRRGKGTYQKLRRTMQELQENGILFGASVTVQKQNMQEVLSREFTEALFLAGCRALVYVEYVPADRSSADLAPDEKDRVYIEDRLRQLRETQKELLFISFPGDEKSSGGCLAAGRGFFHINPTGGAEPCPFSPYSDTSLANISLKEALQSPLFLLLRSSGNLMQEHNGGCVLFEQEEQVKKLRDKAVAMFPAEGRIAAGNENGEKEAWA